ncbi:MAG: DNA mismatch repair protein MutS [Abditibacteriota bacterium]|nr:DNA mismatch repair protein MutS [Abditibacteriota bacterium]
MKADKKTTPMEEQYLRVKAQYPDIILFYRMGDFYEMFGEDARIASKELEITLTKRSAGYAADMPMCGFPFHARDKYIARLVARGYKVAVCDQLEDPKKTKKLVKRGVTRVVTPGTVIEEGMLQGDANNFIVALAGEDRSVGMAFADVSTGEFAVCEFSMREAKQIISDELARLSPTEMLVSDRSGRDFENLVLCCTSSRYELIDAGLQPGETPREALSSYFRTDSLRGFGLDDYDAGLWAGALILNYIRKNSPDILKNITSISNYDPRGFMLMDASTRQNLELTQPAGPGDKSLTLMATVNRTKTAMGTRLLRSWIEAPLVSCRDINDRLDKVEVFAGDRLLLEDVRRSLGQIMDIERIQSRIVSRMASPKDLLGLAASLRELPRLAELLAGRPAEMAQGFGGFEDTAGLIESAVMENHSVSIRDGGVIRDGYNRELDSLRNAKSQGQSWILKLEAEEREQTGSKTLKVGYNSVFGYYIEVSRKEQELVPDRYIRKQTLVNCERYITEELKAIEDKLLGADEKALELEKELWDDLLDKLGDETRRIGAAAAGIARLDVLSSFAFLAQESDYVKPEVNESGCIDIRGGRHPVIETCTEAFVANDTHLNGTDSRIWVITGPNMAGKSTYMRQTALIVLLAQIGCYVPADEARIGVVDRIFTRIGAHDELATGQSTFMVEMNETANIINNATSDSLVILDEIGRGTSTHDGLAIAWASLEELERIGCKALFATHYHMLNQLEQNMEGVVNYRVAVREEKDRVIWLRKIMKGGTDKSYGLEVARLAGLPASVISRARDILARLEEEDSDKKAIVPASPGIQLKLFDIAPDPVAEEIRAVNPDALSPIEALNLIYSWKKRLDNERR